MKKIRGGIKLPIKEVEEGSYIEVVELSSNSVDLAEQRTQKPNVGGWINYGSEDGQFEYLLNLYINSVTHNAIVDSIAHMTYGRGLNVEDIISVKDNKKVIKDFGIFGNATLQVTGEDIFHTPVNFWRAAKANNEGVIEGYWFSTDFNDRAIKPVWFPAWTKDWQPTEEFPSAIYYIRTYTPSAFYYGIPSFQGGLSYMQQEIEIAKFLISYINTKFSVTKIINFNNGVKDSDARKKMKRDILTKLTGATGDNLIIAFNKSKDFETTVENVSIDNASEQFDYMSTNARGQIVVAHQITSPLLVGIRDGSTGFSSNSNEMLEARVLLEEMQIIPRQEIIADAFNDIRNRGDIKYVSSVGKAIKTASTVIETTNLKKVLN